MPPARQQSRSEYILEPIEPPDSRLLSIPLLLEYLHCLSLRHVLQRQALNAKGAPTANGYYHWRIEVPTILVIEMKKLETPFKATDRRSGTRS